MRLYFVLWSALALFFVYVSGIMELKGATAYVPLRESVATGTYHSPNYLSVVNSAIGREGSYHTFARVVEAQYRHSVGHFGKDEVLVRALAKQRAGRAQLLGHYAEERFVMVNHDAGWQKVNDRFAPQRDVWRRVNGRVEYGQIKVHGLGRSATTKRELADVYLRSMRKDSGRGEASSFFVPDDHIDSIRSLIDERYTAADRRGDSGEARWLLKQRERLKPLGVSYETLSREADLAQKAARSRVVAKYAGPVITVTFLAVSAEYEAYKWWTGHSSGAEFVMQMSKTGSVVTLGLGTRYLVAKSEFLRASPYRAGGIVAAVIFLAEEAWLIHQHGGLSKAFSSPAFFVESGGNLGAVTLGLICSIEGAKIFATIGAPGGWTAFISGAIGGIACGTIGGIVGYLGGAAVTEWMLETFAPEFYYGMKLKEIEKAEEKLRQEIIRVSDLSRPVSLIGLTQ
ncbi:MAG: hypothetical protein KatS3mg109_0301 [Pirellulaceae bacterium]|nr:MAG: hypothetical protein KatS3mg109_0301 [Pirellulaceae bacterium]